MINKLNIRINLSSEKGLIHDSRQDVKILAKVCNTLIDKVNELTETVNKLQAGGNDGR